MPLFLCLIYLCLSSSIAHGQSSSDSLLSDSLVLLSIDSTQSLSLELDSIETVVTITKSPVSKELDFITYLVSQSQYDDALYVLIRLEGSDKQLSQEQLDSIHYYTGWIYYFKQNFDPAITAFKEVDSSSSLFVSAAFYSSFCYIYEDRPTEAHATLKHLDVQGDSMLEEFRYFQLAGISALERDFESYDNYIGKLTGGYYLFAAEEENIKGHTNDLKNYKKKSPFVAGLLSALVPGIGKFYAGYRGIPFGAMFINLPLMAVAIETAIIAGVISPAFLVLGSIAAVFYVGNIWGSVLSVTAKRREDYAQIDYNIKYDLHVALRRVLE